MVSKSKIVIVSVLLTLSLPSLSVSGAVKASSRRTERERLERLVEEIQPVVAELTGMPEGDRVRVEVMSRSELRQYLEDLVDVEYPDKELVRRGRCLAAIGLLPEGYDLEAGLVDLIGQEGGGLYDPHRKVFVGISDLPPALKSVYYQDLIVSHELTHALQDREVDIVEQAEIALEDLDYEYAFRSLIEGMATVVMIAYTQDSDVDEIPDTRVYMRSGFAQQDLREFPHYLKEVLISPYAEGGVFVQSWLEVNSHRQLVSMFDDMPATSEQILHPEKFLDRDDPTPIELSGVADAVPEGWEPYYANTLGEFDLLTLFRMHSATNADAAEAAAGWDGLRFEAYLTQDEDLVISGSSVWDTDQDAGEFAAAFSQVLGEITEPEMYSISRHEVYVDFIVGPAGTSTRETILMAVRSTR